MRRHSQAVANGLFLAALSCEGMSYQVPPPKEPSGCLQAAVITRMIAQILFVPMLLIFGGIAGVLLALYAFAEHALLGFAVIAITLVLLTVISKWEYIRSKRGLPDPDDPVDPRMR